MKDDKQLVRLICAPHCRFYRPGEKEELSCQGYDFIRRLAQSGRISKETMARAEAMAHGSPPQNHEHDPRVETRLCANCEFRQEDCDFMGPELIENAVPCGGYVLLALLLAEGVQEAREWIDVPL